MPAAETDTTRHTHAARIYFTLVLLYTGHEDKTQATTVYCTYIYVYVCVLPLFLQ